MDQAVVLGVKIANSAQLAAVEAEMAALAQKYGLEVIRNNPNSFDEVAGLEHKYEATIKAKFDSILNFSHEIRTPLGGILGNTELLLAYTRGEYELNSPEADYLNRILRSGQHLLGLINDLFDYAKIETGTYSLDLDNLKVSDIVPHDNMNFFQRGPTAIETLFGPNTQEIYSDSSVIRQVLFSACMIAAIASDDNKISLSVTQEIEGIEDYFTFRISLVGKVNDTRAKFDFKWGLDWFMVQRYCELLKGTVKATYDETSLEIVVTLPANVH